MVIEMNVREYIIRKESLRWNIITPIVYSYLTLLPNPIFLIVNLERPPPECTIVDFDVVSGFK